MAGFTINGVDLVVPDRMLTDPLRRAFGTGRYENTEAAAILLHLRPADRFLDLGAGAGYLTALAGRRAGFAAGVEAGAAMAEVARANLARNGVAAEIAWGAVVPGDQAGDTVAFSECRAFWASSLAPGGEARVQALVDVPALRFPDLLARFAPTVLSVDIEGGERHLFATPLPHDLRVIVMELHPARYGPPGVAAIFADLAAQGFAYCTGGSRGATVVFQRSAP